MSRQTFTDSDIAWWIMVAALTAIVLSMFLVGCGARRVAAPVPEDDTEEADETPTQAELDQAVRDALANLYDAQKVPHAKWDGSRFVCPAGRELWASEPEALAGRSDYVYCVKGR